MKSKILSKIMVSIFLPCMVSITSKAQHYDDSFFHAFQEKVQQEFRFLDSIGSAADQKYGPFLQATKSRKEIQRMRRLRRDFYPNGDIRAAMRADSIYMDAISSTANRNSGCINAQWKAVGPIGDPEPFYSWLPTQNRNGRLDCIAFKSTDPNILYVGSGDGGGLWKVNGTTGAAVSMNTDHLALHNGVGAVATAGSRIIISTGHSYIGKTDWDMWQKACRGIYYTDDEGASWQKATVTNKNSQDPFQYGTGNLNWVSKIEVHPTNPDIIFMTVYSIGVIQYGNDEKNFGALFKSTDRGVTWTEVNNSSLANRYFQDIEFHPVNPNIIYLSSQRLYKSVDGGSSWADVTSLLNGLPARPAPVFIPATNSYDQWNWQWYRLHLTVPNKGCDPADGDHVMVLASPVNVFNPLLYHSTDALGTAVSDIYPSLDGVGWINGFPWHYGFTMSHDPDISYIGFTIINRLDAGGTTFGTPHTYGSNTHADIQEIGLPPFNGSNAGVVFACTDGGLWRSTDFGVNWTALNNDLNINQFYSVGVAQLDNSVLGGSQDNYNIHRRNNGTWHTLGVGDGALAAPINPNDPELYAWADVQNHTLVKYRERNSSNIIAETSFTTTPHGDKYFTYLHTEPNTILAASDRMYRRANGTSTVGNPLPSPVLDPITDNKATYFDYCFSQPDVIYLSAGGRWKDTQGGDDWNDVNGFTEYNFFKSTDGGMNWTALQTNLSGVIGSITSIAVHPYNPNKIWITFGGYQKRNDYGNQNVFMSTNGGVTWTNYSTGLPQGITNDIIYMRGSNDRLYIAMDRGVYYRDASMSGWECFDTDLPSASITDLDINYCNGKLYAATFGRGIWETNILQDPYPANNPPAYTDQYRPMPQEVVSTTPSLPWTGELIIYSGIKVQSGATLTIGDGGTTPTTIHMPKNGVILVEKGGTLIVDGATLTNSCDACMWAGISVQGTNYAPQTLQYQGKLILKNNAVLEHARNAVGNSFIDDPNRYGNTGGIIQATNTTFQNNARSAEFLAYYDMQAFNDQSYFRNCTFTIDGDYKGISMNYPFEHHVTLWDVHGVEFNGCLFENNLTNSWKYKGDGIYAYNADFDVRPYLSGTINPGNTFRRLKHGIVADGDVNGGITHSTIIDQNSFDANSIGIKIINIPYVSAIRNTFTIGNGGGVEEESCKDNIGIFALNASQFRIEEMYLTG